MARRTEHAFEELGYFCKDECEAIKERLQGRSFLHFDISWSNWAGNCTLIVGASIDEHADGTEVAEGELVSLFLHAALSEIGL